jgi:hypothetical protein
MRGDAIEHTHSKKRENGPIVQVALSKITKILRKKSKSGEKDDSPRPLVIQRH